MTVLKSRAPDLIPAILLVGICFPTFAAAETDYDVTMRMVVDEEELDSSFVQEMQIPESLEELDRAAQLDDLDAGELSTESQELIETLSSQARETRDALDTELPGENLLDSPAGDLPDTGLPEPDLPDTDLPEPDLPNTELPDIGIPDTDVDLLDNPSSTLESSTE